MQSSLPSQRLLGQTLSGELSGEWRVVRPLSRSTVATGGQFSTPYIVQSVTSGEYAFLKAIDFLGALGSPDPAKELYLITKAFTHERQVLEKCKNHRLSRIVRVIDYGAHFVQESRPESVVQYLVFELANGDVRSEFGLASGVDELHALKIMHDVAAALQQLHSIRIAHQDVKPSNVIIFSERNSKLADLGRASDRGHVAPHDDYAVAGDLTYAPPELLYGFIHAEWQPRRLGCDMYLLGSLLYFLYSGVSMSHLLFKRLSTVHHYQKWQGQYSRVLPHIEHVFYGIVEEIRTWNQVTFPEDIALAVKQLCHPDPAQRGHPTNIRLKHNRHGLERYVSLFDRLKSKVHLQSIRKRR